MKTQHRSQIRGKGRVDLLGHLQRPDLLEIRADSEATDRPEGTVDEDANPPLTDPTKVEVDRNPETSSPQDARSAVPPYEGRT
jgi:hypothetical protein